MQTFLMAMGAVFTVLLIAVGVVALAGGIKVTRKYE